MKRAFLVGLALSLIIMPILPLVSAQTNPPESGDWTIADETTVEDETIHLTGANIIIEEGGHLTLSNCTVIFTNYPGRKGILVEEGGRLTALNSTFTADPSDSTYAFHVIGDAYINGCDISSLAFPGLNTNMDGFAKVIDTDIHDNTPIGQGVTVEQSSGVLIRGCRIFNMSQGIFSQSLGTINIYDTEIFNHINGAMYIGDRAEAFLDNCHIHDINYTGIQGDDNTTLTINNTIIRGSIFNGFVLHGNCKTRITNSSIAKWGYGLNCYDNTHTTIRDTEIQGCDTYGVVAQADAFLKIADCDIYDNELGGINVIDSTNFRLVDSKFHNNFQYGFWAQHNSSSYVMGCDFSGEHMTSLFMNGDAIVYMNDTDIQGGEDNGLLAKGSSVLEAKNCTLHDNDAIGLQLDESTHAQIEECVFMDNDVGILSGVSASGVMESRNNLFQNNTRYGMLVTGGNNIRTHVDNDRLLGGGVAMGIEQGAAPLITSTKIKNAWDTGLRIAGNGRPKVYNCSISGSGDYDVMSINNSHPILVNTTFDRDRVFFNDSLSDLSFGWWAWGVVLDEEGERVPNALVNIKDQAGGLVQVVTNDKGGFSEISLIESVFSLGKRDRLTPHNFSAVKGNMTGSRLVNITWNLKVTIIIGKHEIGPDAPTPGAIFIEFIDLENGEWISGEIDIQVRAPKAVDVVILLDDKVLGTAARMDTGMVSIYQLTWDTVDASNGKHELTARASNTTFDLEVEEEVSVFVNNPVATYTETLMVVAATSLLAFGAAAAFGGGASVYGGMKEAGAEYLEERMAHGHMAGMPHPAKQAGFMLVSALVLAGALTYHHYREASDLLVTFGYVLVGTAIVIIFMELVEAAVAYKNGLKGGFNMWPAGLVSLFVTTLFLKMPFGSPGKTLVSGGTKRAQGLAASAKLFSAPLLMPAFLFLSINGYYEMGMIGGQTAAMLFLIDALPTHPLEGRRVLVWSGAVWGFTILFALLVLFGWVGGMFGETVWYGIGGISAVLLVYFAVK